MMQVGADDAAIPDIQRQKLKVKRAKRGECPECGLLLFKTASGMLGRMKKATPINEEGKCLDGRCLMCFPLTNPATEEAEVKQKKPSVPRVLLCHTVGGSDVNDAMKQANAAMGGFSFDFNDDISAITLDRRIRTDLSELDNKISRPSSSKDGSAASAEDSYTKDKPNLDSDSNRSVKARMQEFLTDRADNVIETTFEETRVPRKDPVEETVELSKEHDAGEMMAKWEAPPEQAPPRNKKQEKDAAIVAESTSPAFKSSAERARQRRRSLQHDESKVPSDKVMNRSNSEVIPKRRMSMSGPRKPFTPSGMFIPPVNEDEEQEENKIALDSKDKENEASLTTGMEIKAETADTTNVEKSSSAEIVFDLTACPLVAENQHANEDAEPVKDHADEDETSGRADAVAAKSASASPNNLVSHEYTAYSSKLLKMLDHADDEELNVDGDMKVQEIKLEAVLAPTPSTDHDDSSKSNEKQANLKASTAPTAESSHVPSEDGTHPQCSDIPELLDQPVSPKVEEPELRRDKTTASLKKPPPGLKPAPVSPFKGPSPPTKFAPEAEQKMKSYPVGKDTLNVSQMLHQLKTGSTENHGAVMVQIADYLWTHGNTGKHHFATAGGIKILASTMWADMMIPSAERAAAELFLALVATSSQDVSEKSNNNFVFSHPDMEGLIDALLITMQTIIVDNELQQISCRILCCLASSGSSENDGTGSGACLAVLNAMEAHYKSKAVQEWGVRALYNQCVYSKHCDTNLRILLTSKLESSGASGVDVLERTILQYSSDHHQMKNGSTVEWACKLIWYLTACNETLADRVCLRMDVLRELLHILEQCRSVDDSSAQLQEAVLGLIANLLRKNQYRSFLGTSDVVLLILDTMHGNKEFAGVQVEACNVVANITGLLSPGERDEIVDAGVVPTIVGAIFAFPTQKARIQEPALRALVGLTHESDIAKEELCERETIAVLMQRCRLDGSSTILQQEMLCNLLASVYASERWQLQALQCDSLGALCSAAQTFNTSERIQEAACIAYRNLSKTPSTADALVRSNASSLIVGAMSTFPYSKVIQGNACCALWNIGAGTEFGHQRIAETPAVKCIVATIQNHLEAYEIVDVACGALWTLIHRSQSLGQQFFHMDSGIECVTCTLVMHPRSTALLEKACGILSFASATTSTTTPAVTSDGVVNMVEAMRNNPNNGPILQYGSHYLRNTITRNNVYVDEASGVLTVLINALQDFPRSDNMFLREACYFIWTIAELSYNAKSRIISLGGISIITSILDHKGGVPTVENAALGAYKELAMESARG